MTSTQFNKDLIEEIHHILEFDVKDVEEIEVGLNIVYILLENKQEYKLTIEKSKT